MNRHDKDLERDQKSGLNRKESEFGETTRRPDDDMYRGSTGTISEEETERERDSESEIEIDVDRERMTGREYSVEH